MPGTRIHGKTGNTSAGTGHVDPVTVKVKKEPKSKSEAQPVKKKRPSGKMLVGLTSEANCIGALGKSASTIDHCTIVTEC